MATRRSEREEELMTEANIAKVIKMLEPEEGTKPITKKTACAVLGMAYNVTRLDTIVQKFKDKKIADAERRLAKRGTPATSDETVYIIQEYLEGATIDGISKSTYRGVTFVKYILEANSVPMRVPGHSYFKPELLPDATMRSEFKVGEKVYSARYDSIATIKKVYKEKDAYLVWLLAENQQQYAYVETCELASLDHLVALGVKL